MEELILTFDKKSPQDKKDVINITVLNNTKKKLQYKFLIGNEGVWTTLRDFAEENIYKWQPKKDGKYLIMVQAKEKKSKKSFNYSKTEEFEVGNSDVRIIKTVRVDKDDYNLGDKITLEVDTNIDPTMYKYWISRKDGWKLIKDYSVQNKITFTANEVGKHQVLVECKEPQSQNNFDDFMTKEFEVMDIFKSEIINFNCLNEEILTDEELTFEVESKSDETRTVLFKFIKIDQQGKTYCIQDYSTKTSVSFSEKDKGDYKLLCYVKDMYSDKPYDDRAMIIYSVKPYSPIKINNFTSDLNSPQMNGSTVKLSAAIEGGKNLLYRYKIEGVYAEDSGYTRSSEFEWETKHEGEYKITLWVKDASFDGEFEQTATIDFEIQKKAIKPIKILDVILNKENNYLINETINVKVITEQETDIKYSFIVYKDNKEIENIPFGITNWVNFTPEQCGDYELEIRVKDRFSPKEYDTHQIISFTVKKYIEGKIDYILLPSKEYYLVGDTIEIEAICQNTSETLIKYMVFVDGQALEETDYLKSKSLFITPKRSGKYEIILYSKNVQCEDEYDNKKTVILYINDAEPITNTTILADRTEFKINNEVNFSVSNDGGKETCYEFYLMEKEEWKLVQNYSRKNYYTFIPFIKGEYRLLVLAKSYHMKGAYEDYASFKFKVEGDQNPLEFLTI